VKLWVVDLSPRQVKVVAEHSLPGTRVVELGVAEQAPVGLVVTDTHLTLIDARDAVRPPLYSPIEIPATLTRKNVIAAALAGQGQSAALLLADLNQVAVFDLGKLSEPGPATQVDVLPGARLQTVQDLCFSTDGGSIFVASGDTPRSIAGGFQPLSLTLIRVGEPDPQRRRALSVHQTWELGSKRGPLEIALARGEPIPPGTAIRPEPSTSAVYLATIASSLIGPAGAGGFAREAAAGSVIRSSLGKGGARLLSGPRLITSLDVVGKTQVLLALGVEGSPPRRVLVGKRAWDDSAPKLTPLPAGPVSGLGDRPLFLGQLRAQP
jgi:hypothetical protein